jgi:hypothetical protein
MDRAASTGGDIPEKEVDDMVVATNRRTQKRAAPLLPALVLALTPSLVSSPSARGDCLLDYVDCVERAAELESFGKRSLAGLGCFVDLVSCLERRLA